MKKFGYVGRAWCDRYRGAVDCKRRDRRDQAWWLSWHHHGYGARAEYREHHDRGWHRGWHGHRDKVVVIKKHRY